MILIQRSTSAPELHIGENLLQEMGIHIEKRFHPQKTTDSVPVHKHGTQKHHSSYEVLFDSDVNKVLTDMDNSIIWSVCTWLGIGWMVSA